jgi:lycopene beta-cyclase
MTDYDYIFTGSGCAGLSLLMRLITRGELSGKKVLIIEKASKTANDRTWCFWEQKAGFFEEIVHHSWSRLRTCNHDYQQVHEIDPYRYKMIRGIDFYEYCLRQIEKHPSITRLQDEVKAVGNHPVSGKGYATTSTATYTARFVFNSIIFQKPTINSNQFYLLQHFKGIIIKTNQPRFDPLEGTLMDFRTSQEHGTSFAYVLPLAHDRALVEYTLFTPNVLKQEQYDDALEKYISGILGTPDTEYKIESSEFGIIPMTNFAFPANNGNVINLGTAGGQTKPSSGYTFTFIQKHATQMATRLALNLFPVTGPQASDRKFRWYDSVLLDVLSTGKPGGAAVFTQLFRKNKITDVFRFLDNESNLLTDLKIIRSLPIPPFATAALGTFKPSFTSKKR